MLLSVFLTGIENGYFMPRNITIDPAWMSLRELAQYSSCSERTLRDWLHRSDDALPAVRVGGKILVRKVAFDAWLETHRIAPMGQIDVDAIVNGLLGDAK